MKTTIRPTEHTYGVEHPADGTWLFCLPRSECDPESPTARWVAERTFWCEGRDSLAMRYGAVVGAVARALRDEDASLGPMQARGIAHRWVLRALNAPDSPLTLDRPDHHPFTTLVLVP